MRSLFTLLLLAAVVVLPACDRPLTLQPFKLRPYAGMTEDRQPLQRRVGPGLVADPESPIPDMPKPVGFKPLPARCFVDVSASGARQVEHVYQGLADLTDVSDFYNQNLWRFGWVQESSMSSADVSAPAAALRYTKGPERLTILASGENLITLQVNIAPR